MSAKNKTLTAIPGIRVGHYTDSENSKGCTVVRFPASGAVAGVDVRGSAPGTRETDLLSPTNLMDRIHGLLLSGGSAFGLDAASGVMKCLDEEEVGFNTGDAIVPIVPAAVLYDLDTGNAHVRPNADWGYEACKQASDAIVEQGNVGAGTGATIGKMQGAEFAMKSGLGSFAIELPGGYTVAALVAVNTVGDVVDPKNGEIVAGMRGAKPGEFQDSAQLLRDNVQTKLFPGTNTTIGLVATNAPFTKTELTKIAQMSHDGLARTIRPAHTMYDGDTIFAVSLASDDIKGRPSLTTIGAVAADTFSEAILQAIKQAQGLANLPAYNDWQA